VSEFLRSFEKRRGNATFASRECSGKSGMLRFLMFVTGMFVTERPIILGTSALLDRKRRNSSRE